MRAAAYRFDRFVLDPEDRRLLRDGAPVELSARYFDALVLLVRERGRLVSKERFMDEVWRGVPVTDEALTQCVRALRRALGDDAARPRLIETVPKHGYRFIGVVSEADDAAPPVLASAPEPATNPAWDTFSRLGRGGMFGGGAAGLIGGLLYGFAGVSDSLQPGGGVSALMVVVCLTAGVGLLGGAGVGFGIAAAVYAPGHRNLWSMAGGALGGLLVGAVVKLVGLDAFTLMLGQAPRDITGGPEGALLGAAVGLGSVLASRTSRRRWLPLAALPAAVAGVAIALGGGRLMGGSLHSVAEVFPASRLRLDHLGGLVGEAGFGPVAQAVTAGMEGWLFGLGVIAALWLTRRALESERADWHGSAR